MSAKDDALGDGVAPRFFFIHVMKTAGTSFGRAIKHQFAEEAIYPCSGIDWVSPTSVEALDAYLKISVLLATPAARRAAVQVYTGHFPFMAYELLDQELITITLLREPVERTIAALRHFKRNEKHRHLSLEEIYEDRDIFRIYIENHQTKVFSLHADDHEDGIVCGLTIDDTRFARARENLAKVDVIGLTESYTDLISEIRARFGWWPDGLDVSRHANASSERWDVGPELRARIAVDNAYDVELYAYAQKLVAQRGLNPAYEVVPPDSGA
jgi:hypothetical protein